MQLLDPLVSPPISTIYWFRYHLGQGDIGQVRIARILIRSFHSVKFAVLCYLTVCTSPLMTEQACALVNLLIRKLSIDFSDRWVLPPRSPPPHLYLYSTSACCYSLSVSIELRILRHWFINCTQCLKIILKMEGLTLYIIYVTEDCKLW